MASTSSSKTLESWTLALVRTTASGTPFRSETRWRFEPGLPLSVGFLPVFSSASPRRSKSTRCSFSHTPASSQSRRRRQQVLPEPQPISWGSISQGMPLLRTKMMPDKAARSSTRGRPPRGFGGSGGSRGSMSSHSSSVTSFLLMLTSVPSTHEQVWQDTFTAEVLLLDPGSGGFHVVPPAPRLRPAAGHVTVEKVRPEPHGREPEGPCPKPPRAVEAPRDGQEHRPFGDPQRYRLVPSGEHHAQFPADLLS